MVQRLRENPATSHIPVIFMSARVQLDDQIAGQRLGAVNYLCKPVTPDALYRAVEDALVRYGNWQLPQALDITFCRHLAQGQNYET